MSENRDFSPIIKDLASLNSRLRLESEARRCGASLMKALCRTFWLEDEGQDIAEYAVMLAVILVLVVGTIRLVGSNANNAFSNVASSLQ